MGVGLYLEELEEEARIQVFGIVDASDCSLMFGLFGRAPVLLAE